MKQATRILAAIGISMTAIAAAPAAALAAAPPDLQETQLQELIEDAIEAHESEVVIGDEYDISTETAHKLVSLYYGSNIRGVASEEQTRFLLYANHWGLRSFTLWRRTDTNKLTEIDIDYKHSKARVAKAQKKLSTVTKKAQKIKGTSAKVKYVTKWTTSHLRYGGRNTGTVEAVNTGKAMCYGYALTTLDILRGAGVKNARYVTCSTVRKGGAIDHALCKIGATYTDTCWADSGKSTNWKWVMKSRSFMNNHSHHF